MLELTRLNGNPIYLNSDFIKSAEEAPDTMLTLVTGEKFIVRESCAEVTGKMLAHRAALLAEAARLAGGGAMERILGMNAAHAAAEAAAASGQEVIEIDTEAAQRRRRRPEF
jgi:flagellar protein FlbD